MRLLEAVFIEIFHGGAPDGFFEKTTEILFVHMDQRCQILDIYFFFIFFPDMCKYGLDLFYTLVEVFFRRRKKLVF
ncbi:hypothetical protein IMSAGC020_00047 [Lachnospiraceae bacterium]|nr:hypothetical protein IMSAGC020_00047 [Lachnospiraceae bacterium]